VSLGPERRLCPVGDADHAEDLRQVRLHRLLADRELARDQLVRKALRDKAQDFLLALGERVERRRRAARAQERPSRARVERGLAAAARTAFAISSGSASFRR
jgi:hypothetical protein